MPPRITRASELDGIDMVHALDDLLANIDTPGDGAPGRFDPVQYGADELDDCLVDYRVESPIGRGGMGAMVFLGTQKSLRRKVAIKLLPDELAIEPATRERFEREAQALAQLDHPNIVTVFESGTTPEGHLFIAMEYVEGVTLEQLLAENGSINLARCLELLLPVCEAVAHAHERGISHRDLKPSNILLNADSVPQVADFGLAKFLRPHERRSLHTLTQAGALVGTMGYMAPEQLDPGAAVDHRADIYSLGVILYRCLTGVLPTGQNVPRPSALEDIEPWVDGIILKALENSPDDRYQTIEELREALVEQAPPPEIKGRRGSLWAIGAVLGGLVLGGLLFGFSGGRHDEPRDAEIAEPVAAPLPSELYQLALPAWSDVDAAEREQIEGRLPVIAAKADSVLLRFRERFELSAVDESFLYTFVVKYITGETPDLWMLFEDMSMPVSEIEIGGALSYLDGDGAEADHFWQSFAPLLARGVYGEIQTGSSVRDATLSIAGRLGIEAPKLTEELELWAATADSPPQTSLYDWGLAMAVRGGFMDEDMALVRALKRSPRFPAKDWQEAFTQLGESAKMNDVQGLKRESLACWDQAIKLAEAKNADLEWVSATSELAHVLGNCAEDIASLETALAAKARLDEIANPPLEVWTLCYRVLGQALNRNYRFVEAEPLLRTALEAQISEGDGDPESVARLQIALAEHLEELGEYVEAESLLRSAINTMGTIPLRSMPIKTHLTVYCRKLLGRVLVSAGKRAEGIAALETALAQRRELVGGRRFDYASALVALGSAKLGTERGFECLSEALTIRENIFEESHPDIISLVAMVAMAEYRLDRSADNAEKEILGVLNQIRAARGDHPSTLLPLIYLVEILTDRFRHEEATPFARDAVRITSRTYGSTHPRLARPLAYLVMTISEPEELKEATDHLELVVESYPAQYGNSHTTLGMALNSLGTALHELGDFEGAKRHLERGVTIARQNHRSRGVSLPRSLFNLGFLLGKDQDFAGGIKCFTEAAPLFKEAGIPSDCVVSLDAAAQLLHLNGEPEKSIEYYRKAVEVAMGSPGPSEECLSEVQTCAGRRPAGAGERRGKPSNTCNTSSRRLLRKNQSTHKRPCGSLASI